MDLKPEYSKILEDTRKMRELNEQLRKTKEVEEALRINEQLNKLSKDIEKYMEAEAKAAKLWRQAKLA